MKQKTGKLTVITVLLLTVCIAAGAMGLPRLLGESISIPEAAEPALPGTALWVGMDELPLEISRVESLEDALDDTEPQKLSAREREKAEKEALRQLLIFARENRIETLYWQVADEGDYSRLELLCKAADGSPAIWAAVKGDYAPTKKLKYEPAGLALWGDGLTAEELRNKLSGLGESGLPLALRWDAELAGEELTELVQKNNLTRLLPVLPEEGEALGTLLTEQAGHKVTLRVPQRGERAELLRLARRNAREEVERITSDAERTNHTLEQLGALAGINHAPHRIESYDISNTGASDMVASMVVFCDGRPLKRDYRRFQIKTLDHPDDYRAMQEVLTRRFRRYLDGDEKFSKLPDLLLIDGGEGHARAAQTALAALGLEVPILGMVKDDRHHTRALMTPQGQEIGIQHSPPLFALVGRIQEEVHRFAITYHHEKHSRSALVSRLDGIPGIGPVRRDALRKRFQTVRAIEAAELHELEDVLPQQAARAVYDHFHKGADTPEKQK